jgi:hypothetical protein
MTLQRMPLAKKKEYSIFSVDGGNENFGQRCETPDVSPALSP